MFRNVGFEYAIVCSAKIENGNIEAECKFKSRHQLLLASRWRNNGEYLSIRHLELHAEIMFIKSSVVFAFHEIPPSIQRISLQISPYPLTVCLLVVVMNTFKADEVNLRRMDIKLVQDECSALQSNLGMGKICINLEETRQSSKSWTTLEDIGKMTRSIITF